jgi:hypothetical protein
MTIEDHYQLACGTPTDIHEHLPTLRRYASECQHITEFGVRGVVSTWALLAARPQRMVSYDIADCPRVDDALGAAFAEGIDFHFVTADTREIVIEQTDLLFIDTLHTYGQLYTELWIHCPKVSRFIVLHDTETFGYHDQGGEPGSSKGLWPAVQDFLIAHPQWRLKERFANNNGLTVLERAG